MSINPESIAISCWVLTSDHDRVAKASIASCPALAVLRFVFSAVTWAVEVWHVRVTILSGIVVGTEDVEDIVWFLVKKADVVRIDCDCIP